MIEQTPRDPCPLCGSADTSRNSTAYRYCRGCQSVSPISEKLGALGTATNQQPPGARVPRATEGGIRVEESTPGFLGPAPLPGIPAPGSPPRPGRDSDGIPRPVGSQEPSGLQEME